MRFLTKRLAPAARAVPRRGQPCNRVDRRPHGPERRPAHQRGVCSPVRGPQALEAARLPHAWRGSGRRALVRHLLATRDPGEPRADLPLRRNDHRQRLSRAQRNSSCAESGGGDACNRWPDPCRGTNTGSTARSPPRATPRSAVLPPWGSSPRTPTTEGGRDAFSFRHRGGIRHAEIRSRTRATGRRVSRSTPGATKEQADRRRNPPVIDKLCSQAGLGLGSRGRDRGARGEPPGNHGGVSDGGIPGFTWCPFGRSSPPVHNGGLMGSAGEPIPHISEVDQQSYLPPPAPVGGGSSCRTVSSTGSPSLPRCAW